MEIRLARLTAADVGRYRDIMLEAYRLAPDAFTSTPEERAAAPESWWIRRLADPHGSSLVVGAASADALLGVVGLEFSSRQKTAHVARLIGMYVRPDGRGQGIGARLVEEAVRLAAARERVHVLALTVTEGNDAAQRLYRDAGFVAFGTQPMAIRTPGGFLAKVHMWREV